MSGAAVRPLIMPVYGTRPEAIKMAPIVSALIESEEFDCSVTVTGQHRGMLDQVNELFGIVPDHDLNIIQPRQTLNGIMARTIEGLDGVLSKVQPAAVLVQGDTTTSTAAAIAAFNLGIPVVHVEAGLRSGNLASPFPEEANRRLTSQIASLHLAPTQAGRRNLLREGVPAESISVTGNTVIDALLRTVEKNVALTDPRIEEAVGSGRKLLLVTTHRRENQGEAMEGIARAVARIARSEPDLTVILPLHKSPAVRDAIVPALTGIPNVLLTEPLSYGEFTKVLSKCHLVLTDSGGVQEEAPSLGVPVLVMRENTERPEAVDAGAALLIGTNEERVAGEVLRLLHDADAHRFMARATNPYGDGRAARRTVAAVAQLLGVGHRIPDFTFPG